MAPIRVAAFFATFVLTTNAAVLRTQSTGPTLLSMNASTGVWPLLAYHLRMHMMEGDSSSTTKKTPTHGSAGCRCVGIDEIEGKTTVSLGDGETKAHAADVGAHCEAWEDGWHPDCKGSSPPAWCTQKWCYVDPCSCDGVADVPKPSDYLPDGMYQGKPVHYSYATCGASDSWTGDEKRKALKDVKETCSVSVDADVWGHEDCQCVGIGPQPGTTEVEIGGEQHDYPADTGAMCKKWDAGYHPDCKGESPPDWCGQAWCYVDPCKCKLAVSPKTSSYVPDANYQGRPVYYSYATCGGSDSYSAGDKKACVNKKTKEDCATLDKCAWDGKECLGKELVETCSKSGTWTPKVFAALLLTVISALRY